MDRYYSERSAYIYTKNIGVTGRTRGEHGTDGRDEHKKVLSCIITTVTAAVEYFVIYDVLYAVV